MKNYLSATILTCLCLFTFSLFAQKKYAKNRDSPFGAAVLGGLSVSQVNGDESQGYSKLGLYGGLRGIIFFSDKFHVGIEILYSQKGSKLGRNVSYQPGIKEFIKVNYMEIPILAKIFRTPNSEGFYVEGGVSYARQINATIDQHIIDPARFVDYSQVEPDFNKNDIFAVVGAGIDFNDHYEIGYRFSFSFLPFYHDKNYTPSVDENFGLPEPVFQLRNYMMTLFVGYRF